MQPLLMVVGPTASGKTALAVALAQHFGGEVVSADSMQVYRGMDIATAKPTKAEMQGVPHHLLDFLPPESPFSVAEYLPLARNAIAEIASRGKLPIVAGGTGLYVSGLADNIIYSEHPSDPQLRKELELRCQNEGGEALLEELAKIDPPLAEKLHPNNTIRIIRGLEVYALTGVTMTEHQKNSRATPSPYRLCMIGLSCADRARLYKRIDRRADEMAAQGLFEEAREYLSRHDLSTAAQAIGYKELAGYFSGEKSREEALDDLKKETRHYAKRQLTWFRRDPRIHWLYSDEYNSTEDLISDAIEIVKKELEI